MRVLIINNLLSPNAGNEMYIVKMSENSIFTALFERWVELRERLQSRCLGSATADDFIIRTFSITTCVCMEHFGL